MATALEIIKNAMLEIGAIDPIESPTSSEADTCLSKLKRIVDQWSARRIFAYNVAFNSYTLIPNKQPHTIGPSGDFVTAVRPVRIENASIVDNGVTISRLAVHDDDWWAANRTKQITGAVPIDLYYSPDIPNGGLYLWPIPTVAYQIELEMWTPLPQITDLVTDIKFAPGYEEALTLSLAVGICPSFQTQPSAVLVDGARRAVAVVQSLNSASPRMNLRSGGIANDKHGSGNYRTGWIR